MNQEAYAAFAHGCAVVDVSTRGKLAVTGEDRARLLHAMTTNHVQGLTEGQGLYAFFLNAQGRIQSDVLVYCRTDHFILDVEPGSREKVYQHIDHYIIADDAAVEDWTEAWFAIDLAGPQAADLLTGLGASLPAENYAQTSWDQNLVIKTTATGAPGFRIMGLIEGKQALLDTLLRKGALLADTDTADVIRIEHQHPRFGVDFTDANIPHETMLTHALHFSKGCYLGQEIVERVRSRGHVNRLLMSFAIAGEQPPDRHTKLLINEKEVGEITSAAYSPNRGQIIAIGINRAEYQKPGTVLTVGSGGEAIVLAPKP